MKSLFLLQLLALSGFIPGHAPSFVDPTGTYRLKGIVKNNRVTGHSGELRVRLLDEHTVALCFYINAGYPGYRSGSMMDTLSYEDNRVTYQPGQDSSCSIVFYFGLQKVDIMQILSDPHSGCGFAPGVFTPAVFRKISSEIPVIQNLAGHGS